MIDRHGPLSVLKEASWLNVHSAMQRSKNQPRNSETKVEITGLNLNSLLLGLFLLHAGPAEGGNIALHLEEECWTTVGKGIGATLFTIASTEEFFSRIDYLLEGFVYEQQVYLAKDDHVKAREVQTARVKRNTSAIDHLRLVDGGAKFMKWWIKRYDKFLDDKQFAEFKSFTLDLSAKLGVVGGSSKDLLIAPMVLGRENVATALSLVMSARMACRDIIKYLNTAVKERFLHKTGIAYGVTSQSASQDVMCPTVRHIPAATVPHAPFYEFDEEERKRANTAENMKKASELDIDFFGGVDSLLDLDGHEHEHEGWDGGEELDLCKPRIPEGKTSYSSPKSFEVWSVDPLELARQTTLVDHTLFLAIPPALLMGTGHSDPRTSLAGHPVRRFIDRFNAISVWVTASVLSGRSPDNRAIIYEHVVHIASHLAELNNFSTLTALLTGLKQGSVTRLTRSLNLVGADTKKRFLELSSLMAGEKNYSNYRSELSKRETKAQEEGKQFVCVPHLAAHLAQLSSIDESNIDHVSDAPHLINLSKHYLRARSIELLVQLQQHRYSHIVPVRAIAAAFDVHLSQYVLLTASENRYSAQKLYELSVKREEDVAEFEDNDSEYSDEAFALKTDIQSLRHN